VSVRAFFPKGNNYFHIVNYIRSFNLDSLGYKEDYHINKG